MECLPRSISRLIPATLILLGCASTSGGGVEARASEAPTVADGTSCYVADSSAPSADTLFVLGARSSEHDDPTPPPCRDLPRARASVAPVIVALTAPAGADLRDLLDRGARPTDGRRPDVLITRDADALAYARRRDDSVVHPLPWRSTYVLVAPALASGLALPTPGERDALARDAVRTASRGAAEPFAWRTAEECSTPIRGPSALARPIVAYAAGDSVARQIATRIVALAGTAAPPDWVVAALGARAPTVPVRAVAVPVDSILHALAAGRAVAAVLAVARDPSTPCGSVGNGRVPAGAVPLVDSREHAIIRRGSGAAFVVTPDGALRFVRRAPR